LIDSAKTAKDTCTVARRYAHRLRAVTSRRCHGVTKHGTTITHHICGRHGVVGVDVTMQ